METFLKFLKVIFLHKRMKALYWSVGAMAVSELAFVVPATLVDFNSPQWVIVGLGLVLAQITKALNTK